MSNAILRDSSLRRIFLRPIFNISDFQPYESRFGRAFSIKHNSVNAIIYRLEVYEVMIFRQVLLPSSLQYSIAKNLACSLLVLPESTLVMTKLRLSKMLQRILNGQYNWKILL